MRLELPCEIRWYKSSYHDTQTTWIESLEMKLLACKRANLATVPLLCRSRICESLVHCIIFLSTCTEVLSCLTSSVTTR